MNFSKFEETKKTSIKCHHPPGGNSNFSLGWSGESAPAKNNQSKAQNFNILTGEANTTPSNLVDQENINQINVQTENVEFAEPLASGKFSKTPRANLNLFGNYETNDKTTNSIKVTNAPGGKSNVFLGGDNTSYNEYRRK